MAVLLLAPGAAGARGGQAGRGQSADPATDDDTQMLADAITAEKAGVQAYNDRNWNELGASFGEHAIVVPPNHEPVQGRTAIVDYYRGVRDVIGEVTCGHPFRVAASGRLASVVDECWVVSGRFRVTAHMAFERQSDGVVRYVVDMFGARDPLK